MIKDTFLSNTDLWEFIDNCAVSSDLRMESQLRGTSTELIEYGYKRCLDDLMRFLRVEAHDFTRQEIAEATREE